MGISIPVSAKHYKELKMISDRLGVGVKLTMEYLIGYYCKAEISRTSTDIKPTEYLKIEEDRFKVKNREEPVLVASEPSSRYEISSEIPSYLAARINPYPIEPKDGADITTLPSWISSDMASENLILKSSLPKLKDHQNCDICGTPKRNTAKYCYNCGNHLQ
ncbi:MAG: hypothetical protein E6K98_05775 [Thaumarchaeota archaeon]|nr:MAG: hypothetical protein E6K98_05775 [Nitrososphaerota archaeon]TLX95382.1 MAG: hypothetical protein E6K91_03290 [Nitrososphaerota archaeon]